MASVSVTPPVSCHYRHNQPPPTYSTKRSHTSIPPPKASLSFSTAQTQKPTNSLQLQQPFLQHITNLCESGNLPEALAFLKNDSQNVSVSAPERKDAIGVLLQVCGRLKDIEIGRKVHHMILELTQFRNDFVLNTRLITMYSLCGSPLDSRSVFDGLERNNLFMWNALVSAYARNELYHDAVKAFVGLVSETEFQPDSFTLPCVIKACSGLLDVGLGREVHGMAVKMALVSDVFVGNALVGMYGKCGFLEDAVRVFEKMPERNLVSWNSMIRGFSENGLL
ncbi:hypothetical protein L484_022935 [Morus notabilis]|uniref:Pentatricopeptide repeat-containing protein n=1 Tax=Morus notabilis TaxID=981085 RepID=W9QTF6_9ROSA|nr:hypothetical protein L484_022935 [Morus notabilis]